MSDKITVSIERIPGQGRGNLFFNSPETFVDKESGVTILSWDGYDENENWDDFGSQFYSCEVEGTRDQILEFLDQNGDIGTDVDDKEIQTEYDSGFTQEQREEYWEEQESYDDDESDDE